MYSSASLRLFPSHIRGISLSVFELVSIAIMIEYLQAGEEDEEDGGGGDVTEAEDQGGDGQTAAAPVEGEFVSDDRVLHHPADKYGDHHAAHGEQDVRRNIVEDAEDSAPADGGVGQRAEREGASCACHHGDGGGEDGGRRAAHMAFLCEKCN